MVNFLIGLYMKLGITAGMLGTLLEDHVVILLIEISVWNFVIFPYVAT